MRRKEPFFILGKLLVALLIIATSCAAPRNITQSGKVTPKGEFKVGGNFTGNLGSQSFSSLSGITREAVETLAKGDTINYTDQVQKLTQSALGYSLDPVSTGMEFYVRYGVIDRLDLGYKYALGSHVIDASYQFLGSIGSVGEASDQRWHGSIGLQYSGTSLNLPGSALLRRVQNYLDYDARRRDLLIPLAFSYSFGPEEEYGSIAFGAVYGRTFVKYKFSADKLYEETNNVYTLIEAIDSKTSFNSLGFFVNARIGYKYVYLVPALSVFYQNYGKYELFKGNTAEFSGFTFIPALGIQFHIAPKKLRDVGSGSNNRRRY